MLLLMIIASLKRSATLRGRHIDKKQIDKKNNCVVLLVRLQVPAGDRGGGSDEHPTAGTGGRHLRRRARAPAQLGGE